MFLLIFIEKIIPLGLHQTLKLFDFLCLQMEPCSDRVKLEKGIGCQFEHQSYFLGYSGFLIHALDHPNAQQGSHYLVFYFTGTCMYALPNIQPNSLI
jgi:hypothetical protein